LLAGAEADVEGAGEIAAQHARPLVHLGVLAVVARGALGEAAQKDAQSPRRGVDDRDPAAVRRDIEVRRPGGWNRLAHQLVDPRLHGQEEVAGRGRGVEEGRIEPREGDLCGEDAELEDDLVGLEPGAGRRERNEPAEALVGVGQAEQVLGLGLEDGARR
jgi:hypothetical protein